MCHNIKIHTFDVSTFLYKFLILFIINDFGFNYILYYINILLEKKCLVGGRTIGQYHQSTPSTQKKMDVINMFC